VATILIISSIVKRSLWRASPLDRGARFYSGGQAPPTPHWHRRWFTPHRSPNLPGKSDPTFAIRCCWTSRMEQSANPAARVWHHTRTISTSTQNAYCVSKNITEIFSCNLRNHYQIFIMFGTRVTPRN